MKIAMVSDRATMRVAELSAAFVRFGHQVSLFTRREDRHTAERVETPEGYTVVAVPAGPPERVSDDETLTAMGPFAQYLDTTWAVDPPNVTHAHGWIAGVAAQLATRHLGLPAVQAFHGIPYAPRQHAQLAATVARTADWVAANSTNEVFELMKMGRPRNRTSVVPWGVDVNVYTPDGPRSPKGAEHRIVAVGESLQNNVFDSLERIMSMIPKAELLVATVDDARSRDLPALLRSADVVACGDPSGVGALEAMACGAPVVAPAVGAMPDIVVENVTGRLVPPKDPRRLAEAINTLLRDSFLRRSFGAAGRDRAHARYSWDRIAEDMLHIYDRLARPRDPWASTPA